VFAAKDFFATGAGIFGSVPAEPDRSPARQWIDQQADSYSAKWGLGGSLTEGLGEIAIGLLGASAGEAGAAWIGLGRLGAAGRTALDTTAAVASFGPHATNFANIAMNIPGMDGPFMRVFASSPGDSDAMGYLKNALTSLGVSSFIVGTFIATAGMLKALRGGNAASIAAARADLQQAVEAHQAGTSAVGQARGVEEGQEWNTTSQQSPASASPAGSPSSSASSSEASAPSPSPATDLNGRSDAGPGQSTTPSSAHSAFSPASASERLGPQDTLSSSPASAESSGARASASPSAAAPFSPASLSSPTWATPFELDEDRFLSLLSATHADQEAFIEHGSWDAAVANGHTFASEDHIPWHLIGGTNAGEAETAIDAFMARVAEGYKAQLDAAKGGDVISDAANADAVRGRTMLWGQDPALLLGTLRMAGAQAGDLRANMEAGFTVSMRVMQDAWALSQRIKLGDYSDFGGSRDAALAALKAQWQVAMQAYGSANSVLANSARTLRGAGSAFRLDPMAIRALASMDGEHLLAAISETGGNPNDLIKLAPPSVINRIGSALQLLLVNNLVSNPITHAVIALSNTWQALARPAMRIAGAGAGEVVAGVLGKADLAHAFGDTGDAAKAQYGYLASAIPEAFARARQAFRVGDSIISPHNAPEGIGGGSAVPPSGLGQAIAQAQFGPWDSVAGILRNVLVAGAKTGTFPTRAIGFQDEFVKQVVYRSQVQARAAVEGGNRGLQGQELAQFIKGKNDAAFDDYGRATDMHALREAKVATYQNDLDPGTFGYAGQQFLQNYPAARAIVPFLRTPVNLFRQGVQLTPGLNIAQTEFRDALLGRIGDTPEARAFSQAQALGQMGMGVLIMGSTALAAYQGLVTGDAPSDPKLAAEAMQDGWRPNSIVIPRKDGTKTYIPFDRLDPIMMPFAMAANIVSVLLSPGEADQRKAQPMIQALALSLFKQLTNKLYLENIANTLDAVRDPDASFGRWAGDTAGNYVPYSSLLHNVVTPYTGVPGLFSPDPVMREANTFVSATLSKVPGFSQDFPARRDWAGDPITVHKGLWFSTPSDRANAEVQRLALQQGGSIGAPSSRAKGGVDLRGITMAGDRDPGSAGKDAYDRYQELAGHPERMPGMEGTPSLRETVEKLIASDAYQQLPDGAAQTKGTKLAALSDVVSKYRNGALKAIGADKNVMQAEQAEQKRVAAEIGRQSPNVPTPTNTMSSMLQRLGARMGIGNLQAPSPAVPTTGQPPSPTASQQEPDIFGGYGRK
jgi:hypothetical protein